MKIFISSDHRGFELKAKIIELYDKRPLKTKDNSVVVEIIDLGCYSTERCDYPIFAHKVAKAIQNNEADFGILICGSGVGMSITANRYAGIYAALCWNAEVAKVSHEHDNANILVLSSDFIADDQNFLIVETMLDAWINKTFIGGRYLERLKMIDNF